MASLREIYLAEKTIGRFPGWSSPEGETGYLWFDAPIEIGGVAETGLVLHGGCYERHPERNVTLELRISKAPGRNVTPVERLDWRSLQGGHSNPRKPRSEWSGVRVGDTHLHEFSLNWSEAIKNVRGGRLATAREISEDLQTFEMVRDYFGKSANIINMQLVERPPWVYDLFYGGHIDG